MVFFMFYFGYAVSSGKYVGWLRGTRYSVRDTWYAVPRIQLPLLYISLTAYCVPRSQLLPQLPHLYVSHTADRLPVCITHPQRDNHEKINSWVSFSLLYVYMGLRFLK